MRPPPNAMPSGLPTQSVRPPTSTVSKRFISRSSRRMPQGVPDTAAAEELVAQAQRLGNVYQLTRAKTALGLTVAASDPSRGRLLLAEALQLAELADPPYWTGSTRVFAASIQSGPCRCPPLTGRQSRCVSGLGHPAMDSPLPPGISRPLRRSGLLRDGGPHRRLRVANQHPPGGRPHRHPRRA